LENNRISYHQAFLHAIVSTSNLIENISDNFNLNYKNLNQVIDHLDKHHEKITAETWKEMSDENLLKFDLLMIQSLDHLEGISSYVGFNFGVNAMTIVNNTIENWMIIILLCTIIFVFKTK